ncbi:MAG: DUF2273 domain-containing protein [Methanomassiliicoccales archaeon]
MLDKLVLYILQEHRGKLLGVLLGLLVAILFVTLGFLKTMFIVLCIVVGFLLGKAIDEQKSFDNWLRKLLDK